MQKIIIFLGVLLITLSCVISPFSANPSSYWTELWLYDKASFYYNQFIPHYQIENPGRIRYSTQIMPLAADVFDNGIGSAGKPRLEIFIPNGFTSIFRITC